MGTIEGIEIVLRECNFFFFYFLNFLSKVVIHLRFYIQGGITSLTFYFILFKITFFFSSVILG